MAPSPCSTPRPVVRPAAPRGAERTPAMASFARLDHRARLHGAILLLLVALVVGAMLCAAAGLGRLGLALFCAASIGGGLWSFAIATAMERELRATLGGPTARPAGRGPHAETPAAPLERRG